MASKIITWNGIASSSVPGLTFGQVWRTLLGEKTGVYKKVPGRPGAWYFPGQPGLRTLRAQGFIEGATFAERAERMEDLADWLDYQQEAKLIISDHTDRFYWATLGDPPDPEEWRFTGTFELSWMIQPYAQALNPTVESWTAGIDTDHVWDPALLAPAYPIIEITPTNGTLTDFTLDVNGYVLFFMGNISSGSTVTINGIVPIVLAGGNTDTDLTGAVNAADAYLTGVTGEFPVLLSGVNNSVHFTLNGGTATTIDIDVTYRKTFRR